MKEIFHLRMQEHELSMRQMVEEIHLGQLNIGQATAKFEVTRQTVKHWLDKVEGEAVKTSVPDQVAPKQLPKKRNRKSPGSKDQAIAQLEELQAKVHSLEQELKASKFKALYYSALIKVAEQELDIDIEKKMAGFAKMVAIDWRNVFPKAFEKEEPI